MSRSVPIIKKYQVTIQELQAWAEYSNTGEGKQTNHEEWVETDAITTGKKASLAAYLRGLADELDPEEPAKPTYRG